MDLGWAAIIAAFITAAGAIIAASINKRKGKQSGKDHPQVIVIQLSGLASPEELYKPASSAKRLSLENLPKTPVEGPEVQQEDAPEDPPPNQQDQ